MRNENVPEKNSIQKFLAQHKRFTFISAGKQNYLIYDSVKHGTNNNNSDIKDGY